MPYRRWVSSSGHTDRGVGRTKFNFRPQGRQGTLRNSPRYLTRPRQAISSHYFYVPVRHSPHMRRTPPRSDEWLSFIYPVLNQKLRMYSSPFYDWDEYTSLISGRPAINRSITAMCQAKGRNTICGRGPSSCLPHLTSLDTIHRHQLGNSQFLSGVHPAIICIVQKRPEGRGNGISLPKQDTQAGTLQPSRMNGGGTASICLSRRLYNTGLYL